MEPFQGSDRSPILLQGIIGEKVNIGLLHLSTK